MNFLINFHVIQKKRYEQDCKTYAMLGTSDIAKHYTLQWDHIIEITTKSRGAVLCFL